ncbi:two-component system response regulator [Microvirga roseola]|uniref:two-component system response regulator n=1 Tax=Microvirga roseola TaxID=2883126 RepID=UPI001E4B5352|nr:EAL domain-containing protein [Microvirga roseola]
MANILIVDDRSTNRNIFSRLAQSIEDNVSVYAFSTPLDALEWLKDDAPDLIITDYRMPGMDGAEFTRQIRSSANGADVPVIVITAYDDRSFRLQALEAGATDFLGSPVDYCEFTTRARNLLKLHRQQRYISDRARSLEQQLRHSERSQAELVRSSREALAQVIDTVPAMITAVDREGRAVFVNAYFASFVETTPSALMGRVLDDLIASDRHDYRKQAHAALFERSQVPVSFEEKILDRSGDERVFLTTQTPMRGADGEIVSILTTSVDISERKKAESVLRHIALHDTLTDLPNRRMLLDRAKNELTSGRSSFALHLIDLDRFKAVNDAFGHAGGDQILQQVTTRLSEFVSDRNLAARMSGDEFVILQTELKDTAAAEALAHEIISRFSTPFFLDGHEVRLGCTVGIALAPIHGTDVEKLLKYADLAMYNAKARGRNSMRIYSSELETVFQRNINLEADLRKAICREELMLHYQPQIDLVSGYVTGAEALLRWMRPGFGLTMPGAFMEFAEESGLINEVGAWVLREACAQGAVWRQLGYPPLRIAVNLSPVQFLGQDLVRLVSETLSATGLAPENLELELTESSLLVDTDRTKTILGSLKDLGVRIAIDDFGVGFSSLSYVKNFPVDTLKIDRSFISSLAADDRDRAIVQTIIALAASLRLRVIAEGVESAQQLVCLQGHGCDEAQGYLFSRPVTPDSFEALLQERPRLIAPIQSNAIEKASGR